MNTPDLEELERLLANINQPTPGLALAALNKLETALHNAAPSLIAKAREADELRAEVERKERDAFTHGYLIAVSTTLHQHGCTVTAEDAIRDAGFSLADAKRVDLDDFDMKVLRPIFANIKRRDKHERARAALGEAK